MALLWDNTDPERRVCWAKVYPKRAREGMGHRQSRIIETHDAVDFVCAGCMIENARYEITVADPRPAIVDIRTA
jgi:hypothetical protein